MVPKHFMVLDELPLTHNGKLDRKKLLPPSSFSNGEQSTRLRVGPSNPLESQIMALLTDTLKVSESSICCESDSFFTLGGNSLLALQFVFALRRAFDLPFDIQQLFATPSVKGICSAIKTLNGNRNYIDETEELKMSLLCLQKGAPGQVPIFFANPAGASGLCYLDLVSNIDDSVPFYVLDDRVMSSGADFEFTSVEQAALNCVDLVVAESQKYYSASDPNVRPGCLKIAVGGWSYGGVVMSCLAAIIDDRRKSGGDLNVDLEVVDIILFDSPLREAVTVVTKQEEARARVDSSPSSSSVERKSRLPSKESFSDISLLFKEENIDQIEAAPISEVALAHFSKCTEILEIFYRRPQHPVPVLTCPITHVRPRSGAHGSAESGTQELTSGSVSMIGSGGDHWTMLFGSNAVEASGIFKKWHANLKR
jgi:thioesterase domain-containing protein/acyl carrier protein